MKRFFLFLAAQSMVLLLYAQGPLDIKEEVLDQMEDTAKVTTIEDIINVQESVNSRNSNISHYEKVWSYPSYFNIAYNSSKLTPKENITLGCDFNKGLAPEFKSDWGVALQLGHNYALHKRPIAQLLRFNIDFTYIDFNVNHYKAENAEILYDSNATNNGKKYLPWCVEKYDVNYGMTLGPSITIAPFMYLKVPQLHFFKLNIYYHIGYRVSMLVFDNDKKYDANPPENSLKTSNSSLVLGWGHGMSNTFGFNLSWKSIGFGYEISSGKLDYKALQKDDYGKSSYKFDGHTSRVFLQIRY